MPGSVRLPVHAGSYYPSEPEQLCRDIDALLEASPSTVEPDRVIRAIMTPHAALPVAGAVTASAFSCLKKRSVRSVVLVSPDHYVGFEGVAVVPEGSFRTPLGDVPIDEELAARFIKRGDPVLAAPEAHQKEHGIEVLLPFLQRVLPHASIVPILMGFRSRTNVEVLTNALCEALEDPDVVLVASTDLSHYHPRPKARELDGRIQELVRAFAPTSLWETLKEGRAEACGGDALVAVMLGAGMAGAESVNILRYADSSESQGNPHSVVGYLAAAFSKGMPPDKVRFTTWAREEVPVEADPVGTPSGESGSSLLSL